MEAGFAQAPVAWIAAALGIAALAVGVVAMRRSPGLINDRLQGPFGTRSRRPAIATYSIGIIFITAQSAVIAALWMSTLVGFILEPTTVTLIVGAWFLFAWFGVPALPRENQAQSTIQLLGIATLVLEQSSEFRSLQHGAQEIIDDVLQLQLQLQKRGSRPDLGAIVTTFENLSRQLVEANADVEKRIAFMRDAESQWYHLTLPSPLTQ